MQYTEDSPGYSIENENKRLHMHFTCKRARRLHKLFNVRQSYCTRY